MLSQTLFDQPFYIEINEARWAMAARVLTGLRQHVDLVSCLDVGSGVGWFAKRLQEAGLDVEGLDGREENLRVARERVPGVPFHHVDVESESRIGTLGTYDVVFCFGLLYHTENPFRVIRNLSRLTGTVLLLESIVIPVETAIAAFVTENPNETQGLTRSALVPSSACLTKMLRSAGFPAVYEYTGEVAHPDFRETATRHRRRRVFLAARVEVTMPRLTPVPDIATPKYDFTKPPGRGQA